jgi:dihydrofolate reductase
MINCMVAVERGQGIGFHGSMPWPHLVHDMRWFKTLTTHHVVIMGSTTWNGLGKKLPNRINMVISRHDCQGSDHRYLTPEDALDACHWLYPDKDVFIIGGQALYDSCMHLVDRFYVTEIDQDYPCDKYFNFKYVKQNFTNVVEHAAYTDPVTHSIKEYNK